MVSQIQNNPTVTELSSVMNIDQPVCCGCFFLFYSVHKCLLSVRINKSLCFLLKDVKYWGEKPKSKP